jgi:sugar phosphate permease
LRRSIHYAWWILVVSTLVIFVSLGLARFGYTMVLPSMQDSLDLDNTQAGGLATVNLLGYSILAVLGGALASRYGPRRVITAGLLVGGISMVLTGTASGFSSAAFWRFTTGLASGAGNVPAMGVLASWFGARRRGLASGVAVTGSSIGLVMLGPTVPRIIAAGGDDGWRTVWFIFGGVALGMAAVVYFVMRDRPSEVGVSPLGGHTRGLYEPGPGTVADPPAGPAGARMTGSSSARGKAGGLQWGLVYRDPAVWHLGLVYTAFGFAYIIYMTFFTKYLVNEGGYTSTQAGNLFMLMGWVSFSCGIIWGSVSDAIGRKWALVIVYLIQAVSFSLFDLWATPAGFTVSAILYGLTAWSIPAIVAATCGDILGPQMAPAALGFVTLFFALGQAAGPTVAGALADSSGSFGSAFLLAAAVSLLGAVLAVLLRKTARAGRAA